jgi:hypothetical protein
MPRTSERLTQVGLVALALLASGGAAARPGGILIGAPALLPALALVGAGFALGALLGLRGLGPAAGFAAFPLALLLAPRFAAPLSGPILFVPVLAGVALAAASLEPSRLAARALVPVSLALFVLVSGRTRAEVGADGDEPHYLMVTDSLLRDHDLALEDDYAKGRYRAFHPAPLEPHYRVRGRDGHVYSLHALGLSLLILPAYAAFGYAGAALFLCLVGACLVREVRDLVCSWTGSPGLGTGLGWLVALGPPLIHYSGLIFTEVPAALIVAVVLHRGRVLRSRAQAAGLGLLVAFLPWLNVRYAVIAALLLLYVLAGRPGSRAIGALLGPVAASALLIALYHHALYGFFDPRRVYGAHPELSLRLVPEGLQGLFLDQEFGLLAYAPVFALCAAGFPALLRRLPREGLTAVGLVLAAALTAAAWPMWRGGFNPPGRFLVPVLPALAVGVAFAFRRGLGAAGALLVGWTLLMGIAGGASPRLVHRDRQGTAPLLRTVAGAAEWTRLLPRYVLGEKDAPRLGLLWGGTLLLAALASRGPASWRSCALASLGLLGAAGGAEALAQGRAEGREAVHLLGRGALAWPGFERVEAASARWGPESVLFDPLFEPHRHPEGVDLGTRLGLSPGRYTFSLQGQWFGGEAPEVEAGETPLGLRRSGDAWEGDLEIPPGAGETTLHLLSSSPFALREIRLAPQPFPRPTV